MDSDLEDELRVGETEYLKEWGLSESTITNFEGAAKHILNKTKTTCAETLFTRSRARRRRLLLASIASVIPVSNEEYEEIKIWLKYNKVPVPEVIENWRKTSKLRLAELQSEKYSNIHDIVKDWPSYKLSFGYKLIELDFKFQFKGSELLLFKKWPNFLEKIAGYSASRQ